MNRFFAALLTFIAPSLLASGIATLEDARDNGLALASSAEMGCALLENALHCWGENSAPPPLKHPRRVAIGNARACAIDDDGAHCWGAASPWSAEPKDLEYPLVDVQEISIGSWQACALDSEGVKCWGDRRPEYAEIFKVPPMRKPHGLSVGLGAACVIDGEKILCWGWNHYAFDGSAPSLTHPREVAVGGERICALAEEGLVCWDRYGSAKAPFPLHHPHGLSVGLDRACVLDDEGGKCWDARLRRDTPSVWQPLALGISAGWLGDCAYTWNGDNTSGVTCAGDAALAAQSAPEALKAIVPPFTLAMLSAQLRAASHSFYVYKRDFLSRLADGLDALRDRQTTAERDTTHYFVLRAIRPLFELTTSPEVREKWTPSFVAGIHRAELRLGAQKALPRSVAAVAAAVKIAELALQAAQPFVDAGLRAKTQQLIPRLGILEARLTAKDLESGYLELKKLVQEEAATFDRLAALQRVDALGAILKQLKTELE